MENIFNKLELQPTKYAQSLGLNDFQDFLYTWQLVVLNQNSGPRDTFKNILMNFYEAKEWERQKKNLVKVKVDHSKETFFYEEYKEDEKYYWRIIAQDGVYYFTTRRVICPDGDCLTFD